MPLEKKKKKSKGEHITHVALKGLPEIENAVLCKQNVYRTWKSMQDVFETKKIQIMTKWESVGAAPSTRKAPGKDNKKEKKAQENILTPAHIDHRAGRSATTKQDDGQRNDHSHR